MLELGSTPRANWFQSQVDVVGPLVVEFHCLVFVHYGNVIAIRINAPGVMARPLLRSKLK